MNPYFDDQQAQDEQQDDPRAEPNAAPQQEGQSPLLLQDMQSPEEMYALPKKSKRPRQLFVAAAVVLGAVAAILAMRQFGMGPATSLASVDMDYKPTATTDNAGAGKVLADLERSRRAVQVPAERITQDPFELAADKPVADNTPKIDPDLERKKEQERLRQEMLARQKQVDDAFKKLKLQSVMQGNVPIARIDGKVYKVGMTVGELFTVEAIEGREVTLSADGRTFTLKISQGR